MSKIKRPPATGLCITNIGDLIICRSSQDKKPPGTGGLFFVEHEAWNSKIKFVSNYFDVNLITETLAMKKFQIKSVLFFLLLPIPAIAFSQDILYKKDSTSPKVKIIDFTGKTVKYQLVGDSTGINHFMSTSMLDSLKYSGVKAIVFMDASNFMGPLKKTDRNYFSTELINLFTGKAYLDYERVSKTGKTGFITGLVVNFNTTDYKHWDDYHGIMAYYNFSPHYFFIRTGINFYPFSQSLVRTGSTRLSTGFSFLIGSYRKVDYSTYSENGYKTEPALATSLMWSIKEKIFLSNHFLITGGAEVSILPLFVFFCPQIGISAGF